MDFLEMKILLTGHEGFIGQNIRNDFRFINHKLYYFEKDDPKPNLEGFDWVIHEGAMSATTTDIYDAMKYNWEFSVWLYNQCIKYNVNLQWASSASVYGNNNTTFKETDKPNPESPYAWSKFLFERYIEQNPSDIIVQGFRYFNVYGPHEDHKGNMASPYYQFTQQAKNNGVIKLFEGSEHFRRDFVPVKTLIDIHINFLNIKENGVWNVGTGNAKSFYDVANEIANEHNAKIEYIPFPDKLKGQYQEYTQADLTKLNKTLQHLV